MVQPAKGQEPSMEEILASIRRIIADDDSAKVPPPKPAETVVQPPASVAASPEPASRVAWPAREPDRSFGSPPVDEPADVVPAAASAHEPEHEPEAVDEAPADILDLADQMAAEPPRPPGFRTIDVSDLDVVFAERAAAARSPATPPTAPTQVAAEPAAPALRPAAERRESAPPRNDHAPARGEPTLVSAATSAAVDSAFNTLAQTVLVQNGRTLEDLVREMLRPLLKSWLDDNLPGLVERLVRAEIERVSRGRP